MRTLLEPVITIAWNVWHYPDVMDFVDVILLAVLIYQMIIHVRNTRVSQTLKGIMILLVLMITSIPELILRHGVFRWKKQGGIWTDHTKNYRK